MRLNFLSACFGTSLPVEMIVSFGNSVEKFVEIISLTHRPASLPSNLGAYVPRLDCLDRLSETGAWEGKYSRDNEDLCIQPQPGDLVKPKDGGDSAHRTGTLAFCGSALDQSNLGRFMLESGLMVRHPRQAPWNNPWNATRDQLIGYLSGCWRAQRFDLSRALYRTHQERGFNCQSRESDEPGTDKPGGIGDVLAPEHLMYFRVCTGDLGAINDLAGQLNLYIGIHFLSTDLDTEINQTLLMAIVCGQLDIFVKAHPQYRDQLRKYWGQAGQAGQVEVFRYQPCIAEAMIEVVDAELVRYKDRNLFDLLLPKHLLEELRGIDIEAALKNLQVLNPLWYAEIAARLLVAMMKDLVAYAELAWRTLVTLTDTALELYHLVLRTTRWAAKELERLATENLGAAAPLITPFLRAAGLVLSLLGGGDDDQEEKEFRDGVRRDLKELLDNSHQTLAKLDALSIDVAKLRSEFVVFLSDAFRSEAFGALKGRIAAGMILLEDYSFAANEADETRIRDIVVDCNSIALRGEDFGPGALPHMTHAYGFVAQCLSVLKDSSELRFTRKAYARVAEKLYFAKLGLHEKLVALRQEQNAIEDKFANLCGVQHIATRYVERYMVQQIPDIYVMFVYLAASTADAYEEFAEASGDIRNSESIKVEQILASKLTVGPTKKSPAHLDIKSPFVGQYLDVLPDESFYYPDRRGIPKIPQAAQAHLTLMLDCVPKWREIDSMRRQVEAIAVSTRSTFGF